MNLKRSRVYLDALKKNPSIDAKRLHLELHRAIVANREKLDTVVLNESLIESFIWEETPQGFQFWNAIDDGRGFIA